MRTARKLSASVLVLALLLFLALLLGPCNPLSDSADDPAEEPTVAPDAPAAATAGSTATAGATAAVPSASLPSPTATPEAATCTSKDGAVQASEALVSLDTNVLTVTLDGSVLRTWTYRDFTSFTFTCIDASNGSGDSDDANQSGPLLVDLLGASGVPEWTSLTISGVVTTNNDLAASATLTFAEASQGWLLTIDKSGQVRFPDPRGTGRDDWISMISEIAVTP